MRKDEAPSRTEHATAAVLQEGLAALPQDQREAVLARVLDEREYAEIASAARTSESVVRKRVSRGLAGLRSRMEGQ
jgi:DNA-directed RNA polymerase specialized sigma24 family protein